MSREARKQIVLDVLRTNPRARDDKKELLIGVWIKELNGREFNPDNIRLYCSSPSGIDRDRRRENVLKLYPRKKDEYKNFKEYTDEFSSQKHLEQAGLFS
jgi:hypothetical protein